MVRRKTARVASCLLSMMLALSLAAPAAWAGDRLNAASPPATTLFTYYQTVISSALSGSGDFEDDYTSADPLFWSPEYALYDFGADGVPELLVRTSSPGEDPTVHVFAPAAGKAVQAGIYAEGGEGTFADSAGRAYTATVSGAYGVVNSVTFSDGELKSWFVTSSNTDGRDVVDAYLQAAGAEAVAFSDALDLDALSKGAYYDMSRASIVVDAAYTYDGTAKKPAATVSIGENALSVKSNYTLSYSNNVNAGTATVTATGAGDYKGKVSTSFMISPAPMGDATAASIADQEYTGGDVEPPVTLSYSGMALSAGSDYDLSYSGNVNVGAATVTATGKGNYTGTKDIAFSIKYSLSHAKVSKIADRVYTGAAVTAAPTVTCEGVKLTKGVDYTLAYKNNVNAGTATVTAVGTGSYMGYAATTFKIAPAMMHASLSASSAVYTGSSLVPLVTVTGPKDGRTGQALTSGSDYTLTYLNSSKTPVASSRVLAAGNYYIRVVPKSQNYTGGATLSYTINRAPITDAVLGEIADQAYTGDALKPTPTVKAGSVTLTKGTDYTLSYSNNTRVGTATVTASGRGNYHGSASATFRIVTRPISSISLSNYSYSYDGFVKNPEVTVRSASGKKLTAGKDYVLSKPAGRKDIGTYTYTASGLGGYTGTAYATLNITSGSISSVSLSTASVTYDGTRKSPVVTVKNQAGRVLAPGIDYQLSVPEGRTDAGTYTYTVTGAGNYSGSRTASLKINALPLSAASVTGLGSFTYTGSAARPVPTVKVGSKVLSKDVDYSLSYTDNVNVGKATVKVVGTGNYAGFKSAEFFIKKGTIASAALSYPTVYTYDGKAKRPAVSVRGTNGETVYSSNYRVTYKKNKKAGTGKAVVKGIGNYQGKKTVKFKIRKADNPLSLTGRNVTFSYKGLKASKKTRKFKPVTVNAKAGKLRYSHLHRADTGVSGGSFKLASKKTGRVKVVRGTRVGTYNYTIDVTAKGNRNYKKARQTVRFTVTIIPHR